MIYVANPPTQYGDVGSILAFAGDADGNVNPTVRISGIHTGLGFNSTSVAVDKLGRVFSTGTYPFINFVYMWGAGSSGKAGQGHDFWSHLRQFYRYSHGPNIRSLRSSVGPFAAGRVRLTGVKEARLSGCRYFARTSKVSIMRFTSSLG